VNAAHSQADRQPDGLAGDPPGATGQPKPATYPARVTDKQGDAPAVVATEAFARHGMRAGGPAPARMATDQSSGSAGA
jgi:hypothetical protein